MDMSFQYEIECIQYLKSCISLEVWSNIAKLSLFQGGTDKREAQKRAQVEQDRRLAEQIVLHEARQKGLCMRSEGKYA